jgi:hypothetical protein
MLRRIYGPKRDAVTGEWTELHNDNFHDVYPPKSVIRMGRLSRINKTISDA